MSVDAYCNRHVFNHTDSVYFYDRMNRSRQNLLAAALPAIVQASRDVDDYNKHRRSFVISLVPQPPNSPTDERHRLYLDSHHNIKMAN